MKTHTDLIKAEKPPKLSKSGASIRKLKNKHPTEDILLSKMADYAAKQQEEQEQFEAKIEIVREGTKSDISGGMSMKSIGFEEAMSVPSFSRGLHSKSTGTFVSMANRAKLDMDFTVQA